MDHYLAFNPAFFSRHQRKLLWLLNTPIVRIWFRWVLRLGTSSVATHRIARIEPHAITWQSGWSFRRTSWATFKVPTFTSEFRTHWKYGKRLYYAFRPVWWLMHFWDWSLADRVAPQLSFGFSTLTAYPDADPETTTVDGRVWVDGGTTWSGTRAGSSGTASASPSTSPLFIQGERNTNYNLSRNVCLFNTSSLTAAAVITAATISLYYTGTKDDSEATNPADVAVVSSNPASNTNITTADYTAFGTTKLSDSVIDLTTVSAVAYSDLPLNASGIANISKTSVSKFGFRPNNDFSDATAPNARSYAGFYAAEQTGTTNDPKLVVTYTATATYNLSFSTAATAAPSQSHISRFNKTLTASVTASPLVARRAILHRAFTATVTAAANVARGYFLAFHATATAQPTESHYSVFQKIFTATATAASAMVKTAKHYLSLTAEATASPSISLLVHLIDRLKPRNVLRSSRNLDPKVTSKTITPRGTSHHDKPQL